MFTPQNRINLIRATTIIAVALLVILALGLTRDFGTFKNLASLAFLVLAVLAWDNKETQYALAWMAIGVSFTPLVNLHLSRHIWVILDIILIIALVYYVRRSTNPFQKGIRFEQYVANMFPIEDFTIMDRTRDISKFSDRHVMSDSNPDFLFRSQKTKKQFAVECKWRSVWYEKNGEVGIQWNLRQQQMYSDYGKTHNVPVYIALGVGGKPEQPEHVYFIEIEKTHYVFLKKDLITSGKTIEDMKRL